MFNSYLDPLTSLILVNGGETIITGSFDGTIRAFSLSKRKAQKVYRDTIIGNKINFSIENIHIFNIRFGCVTNYSKKFTCLRNERGQS